MVGVWTIAHKRSKSKVEVLGLRVQGFRLWGLGFGHLGFRAYGSGFGV